MCSEACGVGKQEFTRKQSPWGVKTASDCEQTEKKKEECILTGCSGRYFKTSKTCRSCCIISLKSIIGICFNFPFVFLIKLRRRMKLLKELRTLCEVLTKKSYIPWNIYLIN